jgi:hypothetical protein
MREMTHNWTRVRTAAGLATAALVLCLAAGTAWAGDAPARYPAMAPLDQYMFADQAAEIANARAAAPPSISNDAEILVLERTGYVAAVKGKNGFVCMVQRAWFSGLTDDEFWNPKTRAPICFNPQGARSVLPLFLERTQWALAGASQEEITARTKAEVAAKTFPIPEAGVITYMLAKDAYHSDRVHGSWHPHLMFFAPTTSSADWGANLPGSPVMGGGDGIEPYTIFFVLVAKWSDGSPDDAPMKM